jgi:hypothetical protein
VFASRKTAKERPKQSNPLSLPIDNWQFLQRVDDAEKLEFVDIGIGSANLDHTVFPHERRDMKIVQSVAGHVWVLAHKIANHFRVTLRFHQDPEGRRREKALDEIPGLAKVSGWAKTERCVATRRNS